MIDFNVLNQINDEVEKDNSAEGLSDIEQLKNKDILSSNNDTMAKIEKERTFVSLESLEKNSTNKSYLADDKTKKARDDYESKYKTSTASSSSSSGASSQQGYRYSGYGTRSSEQTEKERLDKLNLKSREYSSAIMKKLGNKARSEIKHEKIGSADWDIFELQQKSCERRAEKKSMNDNKGKITKTDSIKVSLLKGAIYAGKVLLEALYKARNN